MTFAPQAHKCAIKVEVIDELDLTKLRGFVTGPPDTPFEGMSLSTDECMCTLSLIPGPIFVWWNDVKNKAIIAHVWNF